MVSTSWVTISRLDLLSSSETAVDSGTRSWKSTYLPGLACQKAVGGIDSTKKWRAETLQPDLEFDNLKPRLERKWHSQMHIFAEWFVLCGYDWGFLNLGVTTSLVAPMSPLKSPTFFCLRIYSLWSVYTLCYKPNLPKKHPFLKNCDETVFYTSSSNVVHCYISKIHRLITGFIRMSTDRQFDMWQRCVLLNVLISIHPKREKSHGWIIDQTRPPRPASVEKLCRRGAPVSFPARFPLLQRARLPCCCCCPPVPHSPTRPSAGRRL